MNVPPLDLLIIGAGPSGLATAVGAVHRGAKRVLVVEQARELQPVGRHIDLLPNAVRALEAIAPGLREALQPFERASIAGKVIALIVSPTGVPLHGRNPFDHGTWASLLWWQLQRLLLDALPDPGILVLNHQLVDIVHEDGSGLVCAEFVANRQRKNMYKNWQDDGAYEEDAVENAKEDEYSSDFEVCETRDEDVTEFGADVTRVRCRAKIIVGADGINSVARRCIYRDTGGWEKYADAVYSGFILLSAAGSPHVSAEDEKFIDNQYMRNSLFCSITCSESSMCHESARVMVVHPPSDTKAPYSWYTAYMLAVDERTLKSSSPAELTRIAHDTARREGMPEQILQISMQIWDSADGSNFRCLPLYVVPATHPAPFAKPRTGGGGDMDYPADMKRPWYFRRVVLVGDSAHAAPPFLGQGAGMGLEDALELVTQLADMGTWAEAEGGGRSPDEESLDAAFERYYCARLDRVCFYQRHTLNRTSEYDRDGMLEEQSTLWDYHSRS